VSISAGKKVSVHYIGTLDNGRIFDSTSDDHPLVFTIGAQEIFPALEQEIVTMKVGEVRNIIIPAAKAYGPRLPENVLTLGRSHFPADREIKVGQKLSLEFNGNKSQVMIVSGITDDTVTLDGNHALAGLDLTFALRLVEVI
jgi:FKBP-type peptidyl-prolyl cis-trans isomerase 2